MSSTTRAEATTMVPFAKCPIKRSLWYAVGMAVFIFVSMCKIAKTKLHNDSKSASNSESIHTDKARTDEVM